jgi:hypothetical protein
LITEESITCECAVTHNANTTAKIENSFSMMHSCCSWGFLSLL